MRATMDDILQQLRSGGERLTLQRRAVIQALTAAVDHQTIQALQDTMLREQGVSLSETTIYRILEWLKGAGIVSQTDMGAVGIVYSLIDTPRHHHLICLHCGAVALLDDAYFADLRCRLQADFGFAARIDHMAIYGICARCVLSTP